MNYIYSYPALLVFDDENRQPGDLSFDQEYDGRFLYLSGSELSYPDGILVGVWNPDDGSVPDGEVVSDTYLEMRPVGNLDDGATPELRHHHFSGHAQRHLQAEPVAGTLPEYPADNQPIVLTMERLWDNDVAHPGWGWLATIEYFDPTRVPNARAIGILNPDGSVAWTTGAFILTDLGDGVSKWQTKHQPGFVTAEKEDIYYALLLGPTPEGATTLPATKDSQQSYFWEANQVIPGGEAWVDIGQTVTVVYSTVVVPEDISLFPVGTRVRINAVEYVVATIWAAQGFTTTPNVDHTGNVGATIEVWQ